MSAWSVKRSKNYGIAIEWKKELIVYLGTWNEFYFRLELGLVAGRSMIHLSLMLMQREWN